MKWFTRTRPKGDRVACPNEKLSHGNLQKDQLSLRFQANERQGSRNHSQCMLPDPAIGLPLKPRGFSDSL